jgi:hypothetical protein
MRFARRDGFCTVHMLSIPDSWRGALTAEALTGNSWRVQKMSALALEAAHAVAQGQECPPLPEWIR